MKQDTLGWCHMVKNIITFKVAVGRTSADRENMRKLFTESQQRECGHSVFLGYTDLAKEDHWVDWETGEEMSQNMSQK